MVLGAFLARSILDAADLCFMIDIAFIGIFIWQVYFSSEPQQGGDRKFQNLQTISACIGLPAGALAKFLYSTRLAVFVAIIFASAASCSFVYTILISFAVMSNTRRAIEDGSVTIDKWYWTFTWLTEVVLALIATNHGLLAHFCFRRHRNLADTSVQQPSDARPAWMACCTSSALL